MEVSAHPTLHVRGHDVEVEVIGTITTGGSNSHGSDEPEWIEIEGIEVWHGTRHRRVRPALAKLIIDEYESYIHELLAEQS